MQFIVEIEQNNLGGEFSVPVILFASDVKKVIISALAEQNEFIHTYGTELCGLDVNVREVK